MRRFAVAGAHSAPTRFIPIAGLASVALLGAACSSPSTLAEQGSQGSPGPPASSPADGSALDALVARANEEGSLVVTMQSSWPAMLAPELADAFKNQFNLDIDVSITPVRPADKVPVAIAETQAGAPATYDAMQADDAESFRLITGGGVQAIDNWQELLTEINPLVKSGEITPEQVSPEIVAGESFLFMGNVKGMIYNTDKISAAELPKTHEDLADPRYEGMFFQPPWTSHWNIAPAAIADLDRDEWIDIVRETGENSGAILSESEGVDRVLLGQYDFGLAQDTYFNQVQTTDPNAPIGFQYFDDYNAYNSVYYSVRTGAEHPAGATLWVLWMTTPEAQAIWQPEIRQGTPFGNSEIDKEQQEIFDSAPVIGFLDNDQTVDLLSWFDTEDGAAWLDSLGNGIQGQ